MAVPGDASFLRRWRLRERDLMDGPPRPRRYLGDLAAEPGAAAADADDLVRGGGGGGRRGARGGRGQPVRDRRGGLVRGAATVVPAGLPAAGPADAGVAGAARAARGRRAAGHG